MSTASISMLKRQSRSQVSRISAICQKIFQREDTSKENVSEEAPEVKEGAGNTADKTESGLEASQPEESESESKPTESESESKPTESESESQPEESSEPESSSVIVGRARPEVYSHFRHRHFGRRGEKRQVQSGRTVSELVSVDGSQPRILRKDDFTLTKERRKKETTYTFKGWYKDNACTKEWDFANEIIEQDTTIYAKWEQSERAYFTVTYSTTEGNEKAANIPEKQKLYEDEKLEKPSKKPSIKK